MKHTLIAALYFILSLTAIHHAHSQSKQKAISEISGSYISNSYLLDIEKNKTIYNTKQDAASILGFNLNKDSLAGPHPMLEGYTVHEGGYGAYLKFNAAKGRFENDLAASKKYSYFKQPFYIKPEKNYVDLVFEKPYKTERYRKTDDLYTEINRILFEGKYKDKATDRIIEFKRTGTVTGIPGKTYYSPTVDFSEGPDFDTLYLSKTNESSDYTMYHFKIEGKTLTLYTVNGNFEDYEFSIGKVAYTLVKQ